MLVTKFAIPIALVVLPFCTGCGPGEGRVPVSGVVTLDGQPLSGVHVMFDQPELSPNENIGYRGITDESGRYELRPAIADDAGAPPGKYRVSLTTAVADPTAPVVTRRTGSGFYSDEPPVPPERIPPAYRGGKLTFEVPADGTEEANFELKSR
jgi:hypothetical protein